MQFLLGSLTMAVFFVAVYVAYKLGKREKKPKTAVNEDEKLKAQQIRKGFEELMQYDVSTALKGKKVT